MKILIVTETLEAGGAEIFVLRLARALISAGENVKVLSLNKQYENKEMTAMYSDVPVQRLSLPLLPLINFLDRVLRKLGIDFSFRYHRQAKKLKRIAGDYDIVHSHYIQVDHLVASLRKNMTFKHVVTVHGDYSAQYDSFRKGELRFWLHLNKKMKTLADKVDQWVVLSEEQRSFLADIMHVPASRVIKIYNGYTPPVVEQPGSKDHQDFTIGMVARGTKQKGWQKLIDAFLKLPENSKLMLVGGSEYLTELAGKYPTEKRIIFTGFQADIIAWMKQMDVFVLPTLYPFESLPNVITEALFCNLPVVATDVGEIGEMITDNTTGQKAGFLIEFDRKSINEDQLYEKLKYLYDHPGVLKEMITAAPGAAAKFEMQKCVENYRKLYRSVCTSNG